MRVRSKTRLGSQNSVNWWEPFVDHFWLYMIRLVCEVEYKNSTLCEYNFVWHPILIWSVLPALKLFCVGSQFMTDLTIIHSFPPPPPILFSTSWYTRILMTWHLSILASWSLYSWNISYPWNFSVSFKLFEVLVKAK